MSKRKKIYLWLWVAATICFWVSISFYMNVPDPIYKPLEIFLIIAVFISGVFMASGCYQIYFFLIRLRKERKKEWIRKGYYGAEAKKRLEEEEFTKSMKKHKEKQQD